MTPEQARFIYDHMSSTQQARLTEVLNNLPSALAKVDMGITNAGQRMAEDAETWLRTITEGDA